jgi:hypothetical protein
MCSVRYGLMAAMASPAASYYPKMGEKCPVRVVFVADRIHGRRIKHFRRSPIETAVVEIKMLVINGFDVIPYIGHPRD